jgi:plasmid stabilization system protein ParE
MIEIVVASPAEREYVEALQWYAERSIRAAERFDEGFDEAIQLIASDPERFPRCDERHRWLLMRRFPYQIIYRLSSACVTVVAVAHTSREPNYWHGR